MRIWGYIFIFLNIIAAGVFVYFATSVWKARTEWQLAVVKQQLAIDGLPLDAPPAPPDLDDDSVPFSLMVGEQRIKQIKKNILQAAIPRGGKLLGSDTLVNNQTEEVKRVEGLVFKSFAPEKVKIGETEYDLLTPEKRQRLAVTLISLAKGMGRMGVYALYRDLMAEGRYERARRELAYLGRTGPQEAALRALAKIGEVEDAIAQGTPALVQRKAAAARVAIAIWLSSEIPLAAPVPSKSPTAPTPAADAADAKNPDREIIEAKFKPLIDLDPDNGDTESFSYSDEINQLIEDYNNANKGLPKIDSDKGRVTKTYPKGLLLKFSTDPDKAKQTRDKIDAAVTELRAQVDAETGVKSALAKALVPFYADLAGNPFDTKEHLETAKKRMLELMALRATTESEKRAYAAIAEILFSVKPFKQESDEAKFQREKNIDAAGLETLRTYFEDAEAKPTTAEDLPEDHAQARARIGAVKILRDPGQKRRDIAHLLYHLDSYLALIYEEKSDKGAVARHLAPIPPGGGTSRVRWFKLMFPAILEKDPDDDNLSEEEKKAAATALDELYKQRSEWHQRVAAVVGLIAYVTAAEAQATELAAITVRLKPRVLEEQSYFEKERQDLIYWLVELNTVLEQRRAVDKRQNELKNEHQILLDQRIGEQKALDKDLRKAQGDPARPSRDNISGKALDAKTALLDLDKKVDELFKVTKKLGEAQDALLGLELQLREIELGRKNKK